MLKSRDVVQRCRVEMANGSGAGGSVQWMEGGRCTDAIEHLQVNGPNGSDEVNYVC
jgi:hypothetical protein